ncbi:MAG: mevalonate kinase [Thermoprotei archaeon]
MKSIICSEAPAKIILFGEHFVVRGKPAIATAVNLYARVYVKESNRHLFESKQLGEKVDLDKQSIPERYKQFQYVYRRVVELAGKNRGFYIVIDSQIPLAAGMGSSASTIVAFTHALLKYYGVEPELELVNRIAYDAEKIVHGKPSGIDNTVATYGGVLYYKQGYMERLDIKWPSDLYLVVIDTGIKRSTGKVVSDVLQLYKKYSQILSLVYDAAEKLVEIARIKLLNGDFLSLGELASINHGLLSAIGVSIAEVEEAVHLLRKLGALGSKVSGAGRGGIVYGFFRGEPSRILEGIPTKYKGYVVKPVREGVRSCRDMYKY